MQIDKVLGERAKIFGSHYYVKPSGNCDLSPISDPHREFRGLNVLIERASMAETAKKCGLPEVEVAGLLADCRKQLHAVREQRPRPHLDDKVILSVEEQSLFQGLRDC